MAGPYDISDPVTVDNRPVMYVACFQAQHLLHRAKGLGSANNGWRLSILKCLTQAGRLPLDD